MQKWRLDFRIWHWLDSFVFFVLMHMIGVFITENQNERGILSNMVNGDKELEK